MNPSIIEYTNIDSLADGPNDCKMPIDINLTIYKISFVYGMAILAPWNAVLSTLDFFDNETPDYPINFVISFAINGVMVIVVLLCIAYSEIGSNGFKINFMFFITGIILILLPIWIDQTKVWFGQRTCFWLTVAVLVLLGALTAISQSAVLSYMAMLPDQKYMAIACFAMGVSAIIQNAIRAIVLEVFPSKDLGGVLIYFALTSIMLFIAASFYFIEKGNQFSLHYSKVTR